MPVLSKSKLLAFRQCPKRLWLEVHAPELRVESETTQASYAAGSEVGELARRIYDPAGEGEVLDIGVLGMTRLLARTQELLKQRRPIFEAGFKIGSSQDGALALADVLVPDPDGQSWRMVEVKSSSRLKDYHREDAAIQFHVATQAGIKLSGLSLACINTKWTYPGASDYRGLLAEEEVTAEVKGKSAEVAGWIAAAHATISSPAPPSTAMSGHCNEPFACGFQAHCVAQGPSAAPAPKHPLSLLPHFRAKAACVRAGGVPLGIDDVPESDLTPLQLRVKQHTHSGMPYFDAPGAARALASHKAPCLFLDFETVASAVPRWAGTRPYEKLPFQFSLHRLEEDGTVAHFGHLNLTGSDPCERFAHSLVDACGENTPVFVYNAGFEGGIIAALATRFPLLAPKLTALHTRLVDLHPITKAHYYHPQQLGSWSIKCVLPAIAPELRYENLEGVKDGGGAQQAYLECVHDGTSEERKEQIRQELWRYCRLDTFAMVRIWGFLSGRGAPAFDDVTSTVLH